MAETSSSTVASWSGSPAAYASSASRSRVQIVCEAKHVLDKIFLFPAIWEPANAHPTNALISCCVLVSIIYAALRALVDLGPCFPVLR